MKGQMLFWNSGKIVLNPKKKIKNIGVSTLVYNDL